MGKELVVRRTHLPRSQSDLRAAQYVRMSTDYQRYSIENQAAVMATYAQIHQLSIVRTYRDEGESGLKLKNRPGLMQLLADVSTGRADFSHILVYDVSRWGRFQDIDESAHYEFLCKQAGIKITYCAEQFDNDGTMLSSIVKNLKRVMAAEYSRELSVKVHAGASRFARLGFARGGQTAYGLRRILVDEKQRTKAILRNGERKYLATDHVRLVPGACEEVMVVKWIFERFLQRQSEAAIAQELNKNCIPTNTGRVWNPGLIGRILRNENYIGNLVYNRRSYKLKETRKYNPPDLWVRSEGCIEPIIKQDEFLRAAKIIEERRVDLSEEEMLARLRKLLMKHRKLNGPIIEQAIGVPCVVTYQNHFGSLRNAYRLIGYASKRDCEYLESRGKWAGLMTDLASQLADSIQRLGKRPTFYSATNCLVLSAKTGISFRLARWQPGKKATHAALWSINVRAHLFPGWIVSIRLTERNTDLLDYLLVPTALVPGRQIRFSEEARLNHGVEQFEDFDTLIRTLVQRLAKTDHASSTKSIQSKQRQRERRPKNKSDHGRR